MNILWTPDNKPPLVTEDAKQELVDQLFVHGAIPTAMLGFNRLRDEDELLAVQLQSLGNNLDTYLSATEWPKRMLRIGAAVSYLAYRGSGYYQTVDEQSFIRATDSAIDEGIPEAYLISVQNDPTLLNVVETFLDAPDFKEGVIPIDTGGYGQLMTIGAGYTRHYLQSAVIAA